MNGAHCRGGLGMGVGSCRGGIHFGGVGSHRVLLVSVKVWWDGGKPGGGHVFGEWEAIEGSHWLDGWLGEWEATGVLCIGGGGGAIEGWQQKVGSYGEVSCIGGRIGWEGGKLQGWCMLEGGWGWEAAGEHVPWGWG